MKKTALIEMGKDGKFTIFTLDIESTIIGEGTSVEEARSDFENSLKEVIECYTENNEPLPDELQDIEFVFKYDTPSFLNYYKYLNMTQFAKFAGINPSLMRQYKRGQYISEKQVSKIQSAVHKIGKELAAIKLL
ncbi:MAG: pilus assembly protein HicB [Bacteroidales bacterium]|nr:pilus assembly protein HicB [Bacteroidales bacterium]MBR0078643.1 pilus assembly protein HicB [Bacteroidales bacterium]